MQIAYLILTSLSFLGIFILICLNKPGFNVIYAHLIKTKHAFPVLSLTVSFKGRPVSYINPMIYIKSSKGLYKASLYSGTAETKDNLPIVRDTPSVITHEKILPASLGVFNINVFYPTEFSSKNITYLYVTGKNKRVKKIKLKYKIS